MRLTDQQRNAFDIEVINLPTKYRERGTDWMCRRGDRVAKNNLCLSTQQFLSNPLLLAGKSLPITIRVPALRLDRPPNLEPAFRRACRAFEPRSAEQNGNPLRTNSLYRPGHGSD
jgi:hypothetical protein